MKTSCLRLKLVELNFLVSFNTDDQSKTDVANAINVITDILCFVCAIECYGGYNHKQDIPGDTVCSPTTVRSN